MHDKSRSNIKIRVANNKIMGASVEGKLNTFVRNLAGYEGIPASTSFQIKGTVVPELNKELLSVDDFYRYGEYCSITPTRL